MNKSSFSIEQTYLLGDLVKLFKWAISINQKYKYKPSSEQFKMFYSGNF